MKVLYGDKYYTLSIPNNVEEIPVGVMSVVMMVSHCSQAITKGT